MRILYPEGFEGGVVTRGSGRESLRYNLTLIALLVLSGCGDRSEADAYVAHKIVAHEVSTTQYVGNLATLGEEVPEIANHAIYKKLMGSDLESIGSKEYGQLEQLEQIIIDLLYPELQVEKKYIPFLQKLQNVIAELKNLAGMRFFSELEKYKRIVVNSGGSFYLYTTPEFAVEAGMGTGTRIIQPEPFGSPSATRTYSKYVLIFPISCTKLNGGDSGENEVRFDCNQRFVARDDNPAYVAEGRYGVTPDGQMFGDFGVGEGYAEHLLKILDSKLVVGGYVVPWTK